MVRKGPPGVGHLTGAETPPGRIREPFWAARWGGKKSDPEARGLTACGGPGEGAAVGPVVRQRSWGQIAAATRPKSTQRRRVNDGWHMRRCKQVRRSPVNRTLIIRDAASSGSPPDPVSSPPQVAVPAVRHERLPGAVGHRHHGDPSGSGPSRGHVGGPQSVLGLVHGQCDCASGVVRHPPPHRAGARGARRRGGPPGGWGTQAKVGVVLTDGDTGKSPLTRG